MRGDNPEKKQEARKLKRVINAIDKSEVEGSHLNVIRNLTKNGSMLID